MELHLEAHSTAQHGREPARLGGLVQAGRRCRCGMAMGGRDRMVDGQAWSGEGGLRGLGFMALPGTRA